MMVVVRPDVAVAVGVYVAPCAVAMFGAVVGADEVKLTV